MSLNIDFPNLNIGGSVELIPENVYKVLVERYEYVKAATGTEQIRWYAKIAGGDYDGKSLIDHTPLTEAASWKIGSFIHHAGIDIKSLPKLNTNSEAFRKVLTACCGREMYWYVIQDTYNGKVNNKVSEYKKVDEDAEGEVVDLEDIPDFMKG